MNRELSAVAEASGLATATAESAKIRSECFVDLDIPCSTDTLRRAYGYWRSKLRPERLPGRRDIDPLDLRGLLPSLKLVDVELANGGRRFRYRLMGENHVSALGFNATGRYADEIWQISSDSCGIVARYEAVCDRRQAHYWVRSFIDRSKSWRYFERVVMPLASDGRTVDMLFIALAPLSSD
ncbi:MAG: PAS domain-containing protein [Kiloniellales bacterium]